jgi:hypothetical protein
MSVQPVRLHAHVGGDVTTDGDVACMLDSLAPYGVVALHGRRLRRSRSSIDHLAAGPSGVYVVDTLMWAGPVELHEGGSDLRPKDRLLVAGSDRTRLAVAVAKKVAAVRRLLGDPSVPVHGVLCFIDGDWPLWAKPIEVRGITVMWPKELERRVVRLGKGSPTTIATLGEQLSDVTRPR